MSGIKLWLAATTLVVFALSLSTNIPTLKKSPASAAAAQPSAAARDAGDPNQVPGVTLTKSGPASVCSQSEDITYSIVATNGLSVVLNSVSISDALPACLSFTSAATTSGLANYNQANNTVTISSIPPMAPNASVTVTIIARASAGCGAQVSNTATMNYFAGNPPRPQPGGDLDGIQPTLTSNTVVTTIKKHPGQPDVSASPSTAFGTQFQPVPLGLSVSLTNPNGTETVQVTISGMPATATLSAGINQGGGNWLLTQQELTGLTLTDTKSEFLSLQAAARAMDANACSTPTDYEAFNVFILPASPNITVTKSGPADICAGSIITYTVTVRNTGGDSSPVQFTDQIADCIAGVQAATTQGSVSVQNNLVTGFLGPIPAQTSATITITGAVGASCAAQITNQASVLFGAASREAVAEAATREIIVPVPTLSNVVTTNVHQPPGTPAITTSPASGNKGTAIPLSISQTLNGANGNETVSIQISNVPATAILSAGTNTGNGIWTLSTAQLNGLTLTDTVGETFDLVVTATSSDHVSCQNKTGMGSLTVTVIDNSPPILILSGPIGNPNPGAPGVPVTFTATTSPANATLSWNFGDGSPAGTGSPITHTYPTPGSYTVVVTATHPTSGQTATGSVVEVINASGIGSLQGHITFSNPDRLAVLAILELSGGTTVPAAGDTLTFTINGLSETFTLDEYGRGVAADGARIRLRDFKFSTTGAPRLKLFVQLKSAFKAQLVKNMPVDAQGNPTQAIVVINYKGKTFSAILTLTFKKGTARFGFVFPDVLTIPTPNPQ